MDILVRFCVCIPDCFLLPVALLKLELLLVLKQNDSWLNRNLRTAWQSECQTVEQELISLVFPRVSSPKWLTVKHVDNILHGKAQSMDTHASATSVRLFFSIEQWKLKRRILLFFFFLAQLWLVLLWGIRILIYQTSIQEQIECWSLVGLTSDLGAVNEMSLDD